MTDIAGKNVLITGGASGIGRLMALRAADRGGRVIVWDIDAAALEAVLADLERATGSPATGYVCDVSDRDAVYATAAKVKADTGPLDILINNAGVVSGESFLELPDEKIETTFRVNTMALFWTTKAFLPEMIQRDAGHVVTIASASGLIGVARLADYASSKFAAVGFDESLRMELSGIAKHVKTTVVCPYFIDTGMFKGVSSRFSFLLPILKETDVADRVIRAIEKDRPRLFMPPLIYLVPLLRGILPTAFFDTVANLLGVNASMDRFVGRKEKS
ncbi:MAG: SDR family oxidoreductase [Deltaproteobacteria bacterium]|nr:SDR family oxidoreductase [Deltaproteobacteria bacterium]